ncbi:hypothetical protein EC988_001527 [Linderina pennispora]|nr:hypothetical protein EC988_001527 [Linderina pennispora]
MSPAHLMDSPAARWFLTHPMSHSDLVFHSPACLSSLVSVMCPSLLAVSSGALSVSSTRSSLASQAVVFQVVLLTHSFLAVLDPGFQVVPVEVSRAALAVVSQAVLAVVSQAVLAGTDQTAEVVSADSHQPKCPH